MLALSCVSDSNSMQCGDVFADKLNLSCGTDQPVCQMNQAFSAPFALPAALPAAQLAFLLYPPRTVPPFVPQQQLMQWKHRERQLWSGAEAGREAGPPVAPGVHQEFSA
ncbi:MAG: hypothetical protein R3260_00530 [Pseudomonas sp.]|nr:hypothetical protein [Pseudomonas sp.]